MKKELVISAYERNYGWIKYVNPNVKVTVYRKGPNVQQNEIVIENNVGQDVHTFFYHILNNYDNLSDFTFFSQDHPFDHVVNYVDLVNGNEVYWDVTCNLKLKGYYAFSTGTALNWEPHMPNEAYTGKTLICNQDGSPHHQPPTLNINTLWPQLFECPVPEKFEFVPAGHFCVTKERVHVRSKAFYEKLVNILETRAKAPWEIERLEYYIFNENFQ
jgi:hypothetical protein